MKVAVVVLLSLCQQVRMKESEVEVPVRGMVEANTT